MHNEASTSPGQQDSVGRLIVVYERVSTEKQDISRQTSVREHAQAEHPGRRLVTHDEWNGDTADDGDVVLVVQDDGVSAFKVSVFDRPGGSVVCRLVESGRVAAIYADAQDRLSRGRQVEWWSFVEMCEASATRIIVGGHELDFEDEGGADELKSAIDQWIARREGRKNKHRAKTGKAKAARLGRLNGGRRRFGFTQRDGVLYPEPVEFAAGHRMFDEWIAGRTQTEIAEGLIRDGIRMSAGNEEWTGSGVSQILRNPVWIGKIRNEHGVFDGIALGRFSDDFEPLPIEVWEQAQARLRTGGGKRHGRHGKLFLLGNGMLKCSLCGSTMQVKYDRKQYGFYETYLCTGRKTLGCRMHGAVRRDIDPFVFRHFAEVALDLEAMIAERAENRSRRLAGLQQRRENAQRVAAKAQAKIDRLDKRLAEGLALDDYQRAIEPAKTELAGALGALEDFSDEEAALHAEPVLGDAEQETLQAVAAVRAAVAGELENADDVQAAQTALRRVFSHFVLYDLDAPDCVFELPRREVRNGRWIIEPVPHPGVVGTESRSVAGLDYEVESLQKVTLGIGGRSEASSR